MWLCRFESLLNHDGLEILLRESAGVEIQLQAVRIVHHLVHCRSASTRRIIDLFPASIFWRLLRMLEYERIV